MTAPAFVSGSTVVVTAPLPVDPISGNTLDATDVSWVLTDETGTVIDSGNLGAQTNADTGGAVTLTLPPNDNIVSGVNSIQQESGANYAPSRALRQATFTFTTASGTFTSVQSYIVNAAQPLTRMDNTFITLPETILVRYEMPALTGWDAASQDQQIAALITAYNSMLTLRYRFPIGEGWQSRIVDFYGTSTDNVFGRIYVVLADIAFYTEADFDGWTYPFQQALKRAQMAEADYLLSGDPVGTKRTQGIVSETIGESTMRFRSVPDVVMPISPPALRYLRGYLDNKTLIGRG